MLLIKNINIISMTKNTIDSNMSILIKDGIIKSIGDAEYSIAKKYEVIDGKNGFVMPGIINMHTHLGDNKDDLLLYLVNGITTIRNMWGYESFRLRPWLFGTRVFNHLELKKRLKMVKLPVLRFILQGHCLMDILHFSLSSCMFM